MTGFVLISRPHGAADQSVDVLATTTALSISFHAADVATSGGITSTAKMYRDTGVTFDQVPGEFAGFYGLQTLSCHQELQADETITINTTFAGGNETIYCIVDDANGNTPVFLDGTWTDTGKTITPSDGQVRSLYSKDFAQGDWNFTGNANADYLKRGTYYNWSLLIPPTVTVNTIDPEYYHFHDIQSPTAHPRDAFWFGGAITGLTPDTTTGNFNTWITNMEAGAADSIHQLEAGVYNNVGQNTITTTNDGVFGVAQNNNVTLTGNVSLHSNGSEYLTIAGLTFGNTAVPPNPGAGTANGVGAYLFETNGDGHLRVSNCKWDACQNEETQAWMLLDSAGPHRVDYCDLLDRVCSGDSTLKIATAGGTRWCIVDHCDFDGQENGAGNGRGEFTEVGTGNPQTRHMATFLHHNRYANFDLNNNRGDEELDGYKGEGMISWENVFENCNGRTSVRRARACTFINNKYFKGADTAQDNLGMSCLGNSEGGDHVIFGIHFEGTNASGDTGKPAMELSGGDLATRFPNVNTVFIGVTAYQHNVFVNIFTNQVSDPDNYVFQGCAGDLGVGTVFNEGQAYGGLTITADGNVAWCQAATGNYGLAAGVPAGWTDADPLLADSGGDGIHNLPAHGSWTLGTRDRIPATFERVTSPVDVGTTF